MNKRIIFWILLFAAIFTFTFTKANAQEVTPPEPPETNCPDGFVCVSRATAEKLAQNTIELKATKEKLDATETALNQQKTLANDIEKDLQYEKGRNSALEQQAVADRAIITALIPMLRAKRFGLINIF